MGRRGRRPRGNGGPWVAVAGARPNLVKLAPLCRAAHALGQRLVWIHTGQHRSHVMSTAMARDLELPAPAVALEAPPSGLRRIDRMAGRIAEVLGGLAPALVIALGDVDSTVAAALAARRQGLPLVHVEAGLRAFETALPEERNRRLVDHASDRLHATETAGVENLAQEGIGARHVRLPGNLMADSLAWARPRLPRTEARRLVGSTRSPYVVVTLHRQANVDDPRRLQRLTEALARLARDVRVLFPVHPRTRRRLGARRESLARQGVRFLAPRSYFGFLALLEGAGALLTDSGGAQVEASLLGVPCRTLRRRTEHRLTLERGTNVVIGTDARRIVPAVLRALDADRGGSGALPRAWDGRAAPRTVQDLARWTAHGAGRRRAARMPVPAL